MGEIADMVLDGFMDEETGEIIDGESPGYPRRMSDRKQERQFKGSLPKKTCACVFPGCKQRFRPNTQYNDYLQHYRSKHPQPASKGGTDHG